MFPLQNSYHQCKLFQKMLFCNRSTCMCDTSNGQHQDKDAWVRLPLLFFCTDWKLTCDKADALPRGLRMWRDCVVCALQVAGTAASLYTGRHPRLHQMHGCLQDVVFQVVWWLALTKVRRKIVNLLYHTYSYINRNF